MVPYILKLRVKNRECLRWRVKWQWSFCCTFHLLQLLILKSVTLRWGKNVLFSSPEMWNARLILHSRTKIVLTSGWVAKNWILFKCLRVKKLVVCKESSLFQATAILMSIVESDKNDVYDDDTFSMIWRVVFLCAVNHKVM